MFIDSHCHLNYPGLKERLPEIISSMHKHSISHALCVSTSLEQFPAMLDCINGYHNIFASVGIHPDEAGTYSKHTLNQLVNLGRNKKVIAIGETGLDYLRMNRDRDEVIRIQSECFRSHIAASKVIKKPLIIHTRASAFDTVAIMKEERVSEVGGVMHCFTEHWSVAKDCLDMGFYISISGIVTFKKNTEELCEVVRRMPLDRLLIETDSPFLAPVPMRGKINEPSFVRFVAEFIAKLRKLDLDKVAEITSANFFHLFRDAKSDK